VAIELLQVSASPFSISRKGPILARSQVRTGAQLAPLFRGSPQITGTVEDATAEFKAVFELARGCEGATLAANATKMARALREARAGEASKEITRLAHY
jgi:hypothetical protein